MSKILVQGIGSVFRGDDGVGPAVISELQKEDLPPEIDIIDAGTPGLELLLTWQGYQHVILVDAADMDLPPGQWRRMLPGDTAALINHPGINTSLHAAGLAEAITLAEALDMLPEFLILYGVQPLQLGLPNRLSDEVQAAVLPVCRSILEELQTT